MQRTLGLCAALLAAASLVAGCSQDPQARYEQAVAALQEARQARDEARERVEAQKREVARLKDKLNAAEAKLAKARQRLEEAAAAVDKSVTDAVLFRTLQRKLLDSDRFGDAAISVGVEDRVVTLTGRVPDAATQEQAVELAREHVGVEEVIDFLEVAKDTDTDSSVKAAPSGGES